MADIYYPPEAYGWLKTAENISRMGKRAIKVLYPGAYLGLGRLGSCLGR